jgi:hypothetical protein
MGAAKRKKNRPCICGSGQPAASCCYGNNGWKKSAALVQIDRTGHSGVHDKCYLNLTKACSDQISKEHLISHSVLKVLAEKTIEISGTPWLKPDEKKILPFGSLVSNCLCRTHNNALTNLDAAAGKFFEAFQKCGTTETGPPLQFIFNGHDIERWLLKMLAGMANSNYLAEAGETLVNGLHGSIDLAGLLQDPTKWVPPLGLYFTQRLGQRFRRQDIFHLAPLSLIGSKEIAGLIADLQGLHIALLAINRPIAGSPLEKSGYRPGRIDFALGDARHTIFLSWDDGLEHGQMRLSWEK